MYQKQISQKASPSLRSKPKSQKITPTGTYGSLSSVVQRAQQDPNSISQDERQQLESAIGTRSMREIMAGKKNPWVPEFRGISALLWGEAGQVGAPIQAKLTIGEVGDKYEQEADRVAKDVVQRINIPQTNAVQKQDAAQMQPDTLQCQETEEDEQLQLKLESGGIQRKQLPVIVQRREVIGGGETSTDLESAINSAKGSGQPLDASVQQQMEQAFGADFSGVRIHTDTKSDRLNQSIQSKAFTTGQDVFFRQGAYQPGSRGGQELIAHELTHVVQQTEGGGQGSRCMVFTEDMLRVRAAQPIKAKIGGNATSKKSIQRKHIDEDLKSIPIQQRQKLKDKYPMSLHEEETPKTVKLNYTEGKEGKKTLKYPMRQYKIYVGEVIDKKTALEFESILISEIGELAPAKNIASGVQKCKSGKGEWIDKNDINKQEWATEPKDKYWPFLLLIETITIDFTTTHQVEVQFARDKYGYVVSVSDSSKKLTSYTMVVDKDKQPEENEYSNLHAVEENTDIYTRALISDNQRDIDNLTKVLAESARWIAIDEIRKLIPLQDNTRFYPAKDANDCDWKDQSDVPYVTFKDLWTKWNKFDQKWQITNKELADKILQSKQSKVQSGTTQRTEIKNQAYTGDKKIMAENPATK